jgi:hypothetical protein
MLEKKWEYNEAVHQLFVDFKEAYDPFRREVLYNILIEFEVPMKLYLICHKETASVKSTCFNFDPCPFAGV